MKRVVPLLSILALTGCSGLFAPRVPASNPPPQQQVIAASPLQSLGAAGVTAAALDGTNAAQKAAATAAPAPQGLPLGVVTAALGPPAEQGFWLKSNLVSAPAKGRVVLPSGKGVAVDLLPTAGGALLSLAAFRALELPLTALPQLQVLQ